MSYRVSDTEHYTRCLRVFAVLMQRGEPVEVDNYRWSQESGRYKLTFGADERLFWRVFRELHPRED